jgi:hypothetical protein
MRVNRQKGRRIQSTERTAGIDMFMREIEFADQPHDLLDVE